MKKIIFIFIIFLTANFAFASKAKISPNISSCPYNFTKDLELGATDNDVYILQQILNSDKRTYIATEGVGAPGSESNYFGKGTREALKRFQALFIEYIGIADGKFNERTRDVVQNICNKTSTNSTINPDTQTNPNLKASLPNKITGNLEISISANANLIPRGADFKIIINLNKEVKEITPESFIVDGGTVKEIRKLSRLQYMAIISQTENAKGVDVQIEAEKIIDIEGFKNSNASNEVYVNVANDGVGGVETTTTTNPLNYISDTLGNLLQQALSGKPTTQVCNGVQILASASCTPGIGQTPQQPIASSPSGSGNSGGSPAGGGMGQLTQMLSGLLGGGKAGGGLLGGNNSSSGAGNGSGAGGGNGQPGSTGSGTQTSAGDTGNCGGTLDDSAMRALLLKDNIKVNKPKPKTSLDQMPTKIALLLGDLKKTCATCEIIITGGTEQGHATHGPNKAIFDLSKNYENTNQLIRSMGKSLGGSGIFKERYEYKGAIFNYEVPGNGEPHWHVIATGYGCAK